MQHEEYTKTKWCSMRWEYKKFSASHSGDKWMFTFNSTRIFCCYEKDIGLTVLCSLLTRKQIMCTNFWHTVYAENWQNFYWYYDAPRTKQWILNGLSRCNYCTSMSLWLRFVYANRWISHWWWTSFIVKKWKPCIICRKMKICSNI